MASASFALLTAPRWLSAALPAPPARLARYMPPATRELGLSHSERLRLRYATSSWLAAPLTGNLRHTPRSVSHRSLRRHVAACGGNITARSPPRHVRSALAHSCSRACPRHAPRGRLKTSAQGESKNSLRYNASKKASQASRASWVHAQYRNGIGRTEGAVCGEDKVLWVWADK